MTPKENALRIIRFNHPERVQMEPPTHDIGYLGCNHEGFQGGGHHLPVGSVWTDIWGTTWHKEHEGVMGFPRGNPLADLVNGLRSYHGPDPNDERLIKPLHEGVEGWSRDDAFLCGSHRIMDFQLGIARHYVSAGVEMVGLSDDLGTQTRLLLSREMIEDLLVPEYRRLFELYRRHGVLVRFHSCGHIEPIIDIFMDLGVDILNPIQASANDLAAVRVRTAGRMALHGGVPSALMASGPAEAIRDEARRLMRRLGGEGGYFCSPDQGMPWPAEHFQALRDTVEKEGWYPLA